MNTNIILFFVILYFIGLLYIANRTSRNSDNQSFFIGNRKSKWWLVAFGMIGTSLSGVTFISVPGTVGKLTGTEYIYGGFEYYMMVIGFFLGYFIVAFVLLPLYYKMNLTSIYTYLGRRFNVEAHKTGSIFFIVSRAIGATARLFLVINVLQLFLLNQIGIPFWLTTLIILIMIVLYTYEGGVKTIVVTDTLQTSFMILSLVICIIYVLTQLDLSVSEGYSKISEYNYTHLMNFDTNSATFFLKTIIGGMFITIGMTGLDQEMMQKNISVDNLYNSKKNMLTFASILLIVNFAFLFLGGLLYLYAMQNGAVYGDGVFGFIFPALSLQGYFPIFLSVIFIIGLISALFPSADGALTSLTSSFCVDLLKMNDNEKTTEKQKKKTRITVHLAFTVVFFLLILIFKWINDKSIVYLIMSIAGYTYGPLLGLFAFGILTKRTINIRFSILSIALIAPVITFLINEYFIHYTDYRIGVELIVLNGLLTFVGLWLFSKKKQKSMA